MRLLMVAPPGAGKGTQAEILAKRFDIEHIASGELLRAEVNQNTDIGQQARRHLQSGDLVPDDIVLSMVMRRVIAAAANGGYILDGFPRTLVQARAASDRARDDDIRLQAVIALEVSEDELRRRMLGRAATEGRADDQRATIDHRLEVYKAQTMPLLEYYRSREILRAVNGEQSVDGVASAILEVLEELVPERFHQTT